MFFCAPSVHSARGSCQCHIITVVSSISEEKREKYIKMNEDEFLYDNDLYSVLGLTKASLTNDEKKNQELLRQNYIRQGKKYHPDKWDETCDFTKEEGQEQFKLISNAYQVI